jgi:hypothetical protein
MQDTPDAAAPPEDVRCAECGTVLSEGQDRETTEDGVFCRPCFNNLTAQLQQVISAQGQDINYSMAVLGGVLGAVVGVVAWWGFTVVTKISFGLVAVVIGLTVGKGVTMLTGGKRSVNLQIVSVVISAVSYFYATYLVNRTFILQAFAEEGHTMSLPFVPNLTLFIDVLMAGFGVMDVVFLAIVVYEAWKIPAPIELAA